MIAYKLNLTSIHSLSLIWIPWWYNRTRILLMVKAKKRNKRMSSMREKHLSAIAFATASNSRLNVFRFLCRFATLFLSDTIELESTSRCACLSASRSIAFWTAARLASMWAKQRDGERAKIELILLTFSTRQNFFFHLVRKTLVVEFRPNVMSVTSPTLSQHKIK